MNNTLILRRRGFEAFQGWQLWLQVFFVLSLFTSIFLIYLITDDTKIFTEPYVYGAALFGLVFYSYGLFLKKSKLEVDEFGLSQVTEVPSFLKRFYPSWKISWEEIQSVKKAKNSLLKDSTLLPLDFKLLNRTIKVVPSQWVDPEEKSKTWLFYYKKVVIKFEDNVLVKILESKGLLNNSGQSNI